ncbi:hypothetical protein Peur_023707 [Populus x canadensis]
MQGEGRERLDFLKSLEITAFRRAERYKVGGRTRLTSSVVPVGNGEWPPPDGNIKINVEGYVFYSEIGALLKNEEAIMPDCAR